MTSKAEAKRKGNGIITSQNFLISLNAVKKDDGKFNI